MTNPKQLAAYVGFTEPEVQALCERYQMNFDEIRRWYDGYCFENSLHIYSPRSVVSAMLSRCYDNFWNQTETFEALRDYLILNFDGLRDLVTCLLAGERKKINVGTFTNDMTNLNSADDVLTLLVHLGYLGYDFTTQEVFIPNSEMESLIWYFFPRKSHPDKPALVIELKWDKSAPGAIYQIKDRKYVHALQEYHGNLLLIGINYDKKSKTHECQIDPFILP